MKTLLLLGLILVSACNGGGGGGSTPEADILDLRLSEGSGKWRLQYNEGVGYHEKELEFTDDEAIYDETFWIGAQPQSQTSKRIILMAFGTKRMVGTNASDSSEQWIWNYFFNGNLLRLCDDQNICYEFTKQP